MKTDEEVLREYYETVVYMDSDPKISFHELNEGVKKSIKGSMGFRIYILGVRFRDVEESIIKNIEKDIMRIRKAFSKNTK